MWIGGSSINCAGSRKVPLLLKGILTAEDALLAVERGNRCESWFQNHGGRYLDYAPSSLEVLPEIVEAVKGECPC